MSIHGPDALKQEFQRCCVITKINVKYIKKINSEDLQHAA